MSIYDEKSFCMYCKTEIRDALEKVAGYHRQCELETNNFLATIDPKKYALKMNRAKPIHVGPTITDPNYPPEKFWHLGEISQVEFYELPIFMYVGTIAVAKKELFKGHIEQFRTMKTYDFKFKGDYNCRNKKLRSYHQTLQMEPLYFGKMKIEVDYQLLEEIIKSLTTTRSNSLQKIECIQFVEYNNVWLPWFYIRNSEWVVLISPLVEVD